MQEEEGVDLGDDDGYGDGDGDDDDPGNDGDDGDADDDADDDGGGDDDEDDPGGDDVMMMIIMVRMWMRLVTTATTAYNIDRDARNSYNSTTAPPTTTPTPTPTPTLNHKNSANPSSVPGRKRPETISEMWLAETSHE